MTETRLDEVFAAGDSPPQDRLIEAVERPAFTPVGETVFVGYDIHGNEIHYNQDGTPTNP